MLRQTIDSLKPQKAVDEVYRVVDKQLRSNRQGGLYLLLQLADRTGVVSGMRWNATQVIYDSFLKGDYLQIQGMAQLHNGSLQLIVQDFDTVDPKPINPEDFDALDRSMVEKNWNRLLELVSTIESLEIRELATSFCDDPMIRHSFQLAPAGVKTHHAHPGGLLLHVVGLMEIVHKIAGCYPQVDRDSAIGAMLHDIGKIEELAFEGELSYTDPGQLIGHLVQGVQILDRKAADTAKKIGKAIPREVLWRIQHMIVSHHGHLEHGSPKSPDDFGSNHFAPHR